MYLPTIAFVLLVCFYWIYKKIRAPLYKPGMVSSWLRTNPKAFDDESLYSQGTTTTWRMPNNVDLFFFPPPLQQSTIPRPVLAIHGGPSIPPSEPWKLCEKIANVYLYHARGCGHSTRIYTEFPTKGMWPGMKLLEEKLGIGAQVADVERIRRRLSCDGEKKIDLIGHSFGGFIATMYACEFPEHVRSLTLLVPASVLVLPAPKDIPDFFTVVGDKIRALGNSQYVNEYDSFLKRYFDFSNLPNETDESLARRHMEFAVHYARAQGTNTNMELNQIEAGLTGGMACYASFLSLGIEHNYMDDCKKRLAQSDFPVTIVHGEKDLMPENATRQYVELFPARNVTWEVIPDEAHFLFDHPRTVGIVQETMARVKSQMKR